jgi:uncharacterized protein (TIGR02246 family)
MRCAIVAGTALLAACVGDLGTKPGLERQREVMQHYASLLNGAPPNADSVSAMYAPDGELLPNGRDAIHGPAAIRTFLSSFGKVQVDSASMPVTSVTVLNDHAVVWGTYYQRAILPNGDTLRPHGRYVVELVRDNSNGVWKIQRAMTQP